MLTVAIGTYWCVENADLSRFSMDALTVHLGDLKVTRTAGSRNVGSIDVRARIVPWLNRVASMAIAASRAVSSVSDSSGMDTVLVRFDRPRYVKVELFYELRIRVAIPTGFREPSRVNGRARIVERSKNVNVSVTFQAGRSITIALFPRLPVTAPVVLFHDIVVTLLASYVGKLIFVGQLRDIGVAVGTR